MKTYYYISNGKKEGPIDAERMRAAIERGTIKGNTKVWTRGMQNWMPADRTPLSEYFDDNPPDIPLEEASNQYVWMLATIPMIVCSICIHMGLGLYANIIMWVLNTVFVILDARELGKCGIDIGKTIWLGFIIIPAYLFVRSSKIDKNYGYSITWCALFLVSLFIY